MKKGLFLCIAILLLKGGTFAQTSWTGTTSTNWSTAANWTAGVPTATIDAIIGDASFTGSFQPLLTANSACKSLTIGTGAVASTLTIARNITVSGAVVIGGNGSILHSTVATTITVRGNWTNSGTYSATVATAGVTFSGTAQTITGPTTFRQMTINAGSSTTLASSITVNTGLAVSGTLDPTASLSVAGTGTFTVNSGGTIHVKAADFVTNYSLSGAISLNGRGTVNYSSSSINQTVSNALTYGYLRISGGLVKSLSGNLPALKSGTANEGRIYIDAGTFDMLTYTANRGTPVSGGAVIIANGAVLKIGGTNSFPSNFNTITIASNGTVEYSGTNQTVLAATYGNLVFSGSSGSVVKTMPGSAMTVAGSLSVSVGASTDVSFTAGNNITVNRDVNLGTATTFNAGTFSHTFKASWTNNGTFSGGTSTATLSGVGAVISGTGTNNFYNLTFSGVGATASGSTVINVAGNLATSGTGSLLHSSGGTISMSGASKTISGNGFTFNNLSIPGSVTTTANIKIAGDFTVDGSFAASNRTATFTGTSKTISGSGTITFFAVSVLGTISTANSFTMLSNLSVAFAGSFTASAGTVTINGTTNFAGTANLFDVTINSAKTLRMGTGSLLGIANTFTKTGTLNVTTNVPNTVAYNSSGAQTIVNTTYNNLTLANGGTKTAAGAITVNNDLSINAGVTFDASSYVISLYRHWTNSGTFAASTSDVQLRGANAANITGATTFYNLTENKSSAAVWATLLSNITVSNNLTMTQGNMQTGTNTVTITGTRLGTGSGVILGTITQNHTFTDGTIYYFEGPNNRIVFTSPSAGLTSVTVKVTLGTIADFDPALESILREYEIIIPAGTYTDATLRMHYLDNELNAFDEPNLNQYKFNSGTTWDNMGFTTRNTTSNYVEKTLLTTVAGRWSLSGTRNVVRWDGSASSAWGDANNWTTISGSDMSNRVPTSTDAAEIGQAAFTNNPAITAAQTVNVLRYGSVQASTLTISSGSLTTVGSIKGLWAAAASHTIDISSAALTTGTNLELSDGTSGHDILLKIGSGSATINNDLVQSASGEVNFTGSGTLTIGGLYTYAAGNFTAGSGTVVYTGGEAQTVAPVTYNNLSFTKSTERATINSSTTVNGNLTTSTGGELAVSAALSVVGNITIGAGNTLLETGVVINVGGNWTTNGTFTVDNGSVNFNGTGAQSVNANTFNMFIVNKSSGTLSVSGDLVINSDLTLTAGTLDLSTFIADRSNIGGTITLGASTLLRVGGNNFPTNYVTNTIHAASTVEYYGSIAQNVADVDCGNLTFSNGGSTPKSLLGDIQVNGNLLINSGSTLDPGANKISLYGNFTNSGTFTPSTSTLILYGTAQTFAGNTALYNLTAAAGATCTVSSSTLTIAGDLFCDLNASVNFGSGNITLDGDFTNKGALVSNGILTFSGTRVQTFQLIGALVSASTGVVNFNGSVTPVSNSVNSTVSFYTINWNNTGTGGFPISSPWTVVLAINIAAGTALDFGSLTHNFYGNFTNNGTVVSSGTLNFTPHPAYTSSATVTLDAPGGSFNSSGTVNFGSLSPTPSLTIVDNNPTLTNVNITSTYAPGITAPGNWTIGQDLYIGPGATFNAGTGLSHTIAGNITNNGILNGGTSTISFSGNPVAVNGAGTTTFNNLTIAAGADVSLNKSISITGNLVDNASFITTGRAVTFSGSGASIISGSAGSITLDDFVQNKTGTTTTFSLPVTVTGNMTLTDGIINTTATNLLTLNDDATSTPGTATSFINGPMKKIGDDAFVFPVGKGGYWRRIGISAPGSSTAAFQAEYNASSYSVTTTTAPLDHVSIGEHWILDRVAGTENVNVTLHWEDGTGSGINDLSDLVVARYNGTNWVNETQAGGTTGTTSAGTVTSQAITSFSPFAFGSLTSGGAVNPLPVELLDFSAEPVAKKVNVTWSTAAETNSDQFIVERSANAADFSEIGRVKAAGNSSVLNNYLLLDTDPLSGTSYYRLKQTDLNGQFTYSYIKVVSMGIDGSDEFTIYPNPVADKFNIRLENHKEAEILVVVVDIFGKEQYAKITVLTETENVIAVDLGKKLPAGVYSVIASNNEHIYRKHIVIK